MTEKSPQIEPGWLNVLKDEFSKDYFLKLKAFLVEEKNKYRLFPAGKQIFEAFNLTPFNEVKVVILGQDPYHGAGQAHGLSFSVPDGIKAPPSLANIYKELKEDVGIEIPKTGNLTPWAKQGVLLLNATLTVRESQAGSHQNKGWELFTDAVIKKLSDEKKGLVFLLWGNYARQKGALIDATKHHVLVAPHPSPLARGGFFGCKHFSKTNQILQNQVQKPINWQL
ncbi:MAG TPA: uracil-DNA glycosylase [Bacteroidia bacterium]|jgi:uracil-DNA glycosylase|nr:uracil-DNA glycosylase [Bacteroidia bacterium]